MDALAVPQVYAIPLSPMECGMVQQPQSPESNHRLSDEPTTHSTGKAIGALLLSLLQWVLPMNPWLEFFIWLIIAGLSGHLIWKSRWTKEGLPTSAKIVACFVVAIFIILQTFGILKSIKPSEPSEVIAPPSSEIKVQKEPQSTAPAPIATQSEPAPPFRENVEPVPSVKPVPHKATPPAIKKDIPIKPKTIIPDKHEETIPIQPKETLAAILIKKYQVPPKTIVANSEQFIPAWIKRINSVRIDREKRGVRPDLIALIRQIGRAPSQGPTVKEFVDDAVAEAAFTLHCLESEGYVQITEVTAQGRWLAIDFPNLEFEFVPEKLNEFEAGL